MKEEEQISPEMEHLQYLMEHPELQEESSTQSTISPCRTKQLTNKYERS